MPRIQNNIEKKAKLEDFYYLISKLVIKLK